MKTKHLIMTMLLTVLGVYLFATAPEKLPDTSSAEIEYPISQLFVILEKNNSIVRKQWTGEIVGKGKKFAGLKFGEDWERPGVDKGPLPALFLRKTASFLEKYPARISLFLGSNFPINQANEFQGLQAEKFSALIDSGNSQHFRNDDDRYSIGMFADIASVGPCVSCHNEHKDSPKTDWKLNDVMGATTWMHPDETISLPEILTIVASLDSAYRETYELYIEKSKTFKNPPLIGKQWPKDGNFLPTTDEFMSVAASKTSITTLLSIVNLVKKEKKVSDGSL